MCVSGKYSFWFISPLTWLPSKSKSVNIICLCDYQVETSMGNFLRELKCGPLPFYPHPLSPLALTPPPRFLNLNSTPKSTNPHHINQRLTSLIPLLQVTSTYTAIILAKEVVQRLRMKEGVECERVRDGFDGRVW